MGVFVSIEFGLRVAVRVFVGVSILWLVGQYVFICVFARAGVGESARVWVCACACVCVCACVRVCACESVRASECVSVFDRVWVSVCGCLSC